jgi:uncharacterized protein (TIGR03435 family)
MRTSRSHATFLMLLGSTALTLKTLNGQTPATAPPSFEVASIKASEPPTPGQFGQGKVRFGMQVDAGRVNVQLMSLMDLIAAAYRVKPYQVSGPSWLRTERFDIVAKIPEGVSRDLVPEMLQSLLAERFRLTIHRENKEHAVYAKLKESAPDADAAPSEGDPGASPNGPGGQMRINDAPGGQVGINRDGKGVVITGGRTGTMRMSMAPGGTMRMEGSKMTTAVLADMLSRFVDRPIVDMTGLTGNYQVTLDLSIEDMRFAARNAGMMPAGAGGGGREGGPGGSPGGPGGDVARPPGDSASDPSGGSSIFAAIQTLGLKLEPRKAPAEAIVIDHLEKTPTDN